MICCMLEEIDHCEIGGIYMHTVEDLENTLKDIFSICTIGIIIVGYLFNAFQFLLI